MTQKPTDPIFLENLLDFILTTDNVGKVKIELGMSVSQLKRHMKRHFDTQSLNKIRIEHNVEPLKGNRNVLNEIDLSDQEIFDFVADARSLKVECQDYLGMSYARFRRFATRKYGTASKIELRKKLGLRYNQQNTIRILKELTLEKVIDFFDKYQTSRSRKGRYFDFFGVEEDIFYDHLLEKYDTIQIKELREILHEQLNR